MKQSNTSSLAISQTASITLIGLAVLTTPMLILRSASSAITGSEISLVFSLGLAGFGVTLYALHLLTVVVPRRSLHQIAHTYIGGWAGIVVAAAKILAYALLIMMGVDLLTIGVVAIIGQGVWSIWLPPVAIALLAVPSLYARLQTPVTMVRWLTYIGIGGLIVVLVAGLLQEAFGLFDFDAINEARNEAFTSAPVISHYFPRVDSALGALFPSGLLVIMSERVMVPAEQRRVGLRTHLRTFIPAFFLISLTLYFAVVLYLPGRRLSVPAIPIATALFGFYGTVVMAVLVSLVGLAASYVAYRQLPRLIRDLAIDSLLPRRLAARDAVRPRKAIVLVIGFLATTATVVLDSTRALATVTIFILCAIMLMTSIAMIYRSRSILNDSTNASERSAAHIVQWIFIAYGLVVFSTLILISWIHPEWSLSSVLLLIVPGVFLWAHRRGQNRRSDALAVGMDGTSSSLPTRVHGLVLIERCNQPALKAVSWARATRLSSLSAVLIDVDSALTRRTRDQWSASRIPVSLTILGTPRGAVRGPFIEHVRALRKFHPHDVIQVFIPQVLETGWWDRFYVRHSTPKIISELKLEPGVMVTEVPYRIDVSTWNVDDSYEENYGGGSDDVYTQD
ncbi:APC family permease [Arcanobacterium phocisimile]|uniref:APC family permease n=1 Tax=Arcanobacterium phocisimile TaxID=1302235 RepID=A0ABX7IIB4_9ACTO|nr:APC family permease [Arcanobacterium phocisimile]QRV02884.1 APC family permease [Arcanobacterium phocisimile]